VRVPNACSAHKSRHQKCPRDCPNRNRKRGKRKCEREEEELMRTEDDEEEVQKVRRGKRNRKPRQMDDEYL